MLAIKKNVFLYGLFVLSMEVIAASTVLGQPIFEYVDSLEWLVADAKVIVRTTIVETTREPGETDYVWETITLKVRETLKGKHRQTHKIVVHHHKSDDRLAAWKNGKVELLLFLVDSQRLKESDPKYTRHELALRPGYWKRSCVELSKETKPRLFTMSLEILTDPQTIVKQTRAAVAKTAKEKPAGQHTVWVRSGQTFVTVPINSRLETLALRWLKLKGKGREWFLREAGAKALGHFQSYTNLVIFKTLLEDPAYVYHTKEDGKWAVVKQREFYIRKIAYTTLQKWNVHVDKPVLREQLLRKVTDPSQRATITKIKASGGSVYYDEIEAPGQFRTVKLVYIVSESAPDLATVAELKNLKDVNLSGTAVRDLSPLTRLSNLRSLELLSTPISDLSPVVKMKSLTSLGLCGTQVRNLTPLSRLKNLEALDLSDTHVSDLSPLAELKNLKYLELADTRVSDISVLAGLTNLESLNLRNTSVSSLTHLSRLKKLKRLQLDDTPVSNLKPIARLINLEQLDLSGTQVNDVSSLAELENLNFLDLKHTKVRDLSPLKKLKGIWPLSPAFLPKKFRKVPNPDSPDKN